MIGSVSNAPIVSAAAHSVANPRGVAVSDRCSRRRTPIAKQQTGRDADAVVQDDAPTTYKSARNRVAGSIAFHWHELATRGTAGRAPPSNVYRGCLAPFPRLGEAGPTPSKGGSLVHRSIAGKESLWVRQLAGEIIDDQ